MNKRLKNELEKSNGIFKVKFTIIIVFLMMIGSAWENIPQGSTKEVLTYSNVNSQEINSGEKAENKYNIQITANIKANYEESILEDPKIEEPDIEGFMSAQDEIKLSFDDAINTSADGEQYTVKAEDAYTFGRSEGKKCVFLTFDDGPSPNITPRVLDTLKTYDVKATFFIVGKSVENYPGLIKRQIQEGHALANHTYTHDYKALYPKKSIDVKLFNEEIERNQEAVRRVAERNIIMRVVRFPGGSFEAWKGPMKDEIIKKGMHYVDWNAENGDGLKLDIPLGEQLENIKKHISWAEHANKNVVILMHDAPAKRTTADALPQIIEYIKSKGYEFKTLR